ncbi:MAG: hypothetical protein AB7D03_10810 [Thiomicrospira sp.]
MSLVSKIYQAILFRAPTPQERTFWETEFERGLFTPTQLVLLGIEQPIFQTNLLVAKIYQAAFGRAINTSEMLGWGQFIYAGGQVEQIAARFLASPEFSERFANVSLEHIIATVYNQSTGLNADSSWLNQTINALNNDQLTPAGLLIQIAHQGSDLEAGLKLLNNQLFDDARAHFQIDNTQDVRLSIATLFNDYQALNPSPTSGVYEAQGVLGVSGNASTEVTTIDIERGLILNTTSDAVNWLSGSVSNIRVMDLSAFSQPMNITGSQEFEQLTLNAMDATIRMKGGNDVIQLGTGSARIVFESLAQYNGIDQIHGFKRGQDADVLDFSHFLDSPNPATVVQPVNATSQASMPWSNGDILSVSGYGLNTAQSIANLFGTGHAFVSGTQASKTVVLSADIVGNTHVWYVVNQLNVTEIEAHEVSLVATLVGINNLALLPFESDNFAL